MLVSYLPFRLAQKHYFSRPTQLQYGAFTRHAGGGHRLRLQLLRFIANNSLAPLRYNRPFSLAFNPFPTALHWYRPYLRALRSSVSVYRPRKYRRVSIGMRVYVVCNWDTYFGHRTFILLCFVRLCGISQLPISLWFEVLEREELKRGKIMEALDKFCFWDFNVFLFFFYVAWEYFV